MEHASLLNLDRGFAALLCRARVAQWIARLPPKQKVAGSNPASGVEPPFCTGSCWGPMAMLT